MLVLVIRLKIEWLLVLKVGEVVPWVSYLGVCWNRSLILYSWTDWNGRFEVRMLLDLLVWKKKHLRCGRRNCSLLSTIVTFRPWFGKGSGVRIPCGDLMTGREKMLIPVMDWHERCRKDLRHGSG